MSTDLAVSMDELELENAELLPSRETLCVPKCHHHPHHHCAKPAHPAPPATSTTTVTTTQVTQQVDGNVSQTGLINIALGNGSNDTLTSTLQSLL